MKVTKPYRVYRDFPRGGLLRWHSSWQHPHQAQQRALALTVDGHRVGVQSPLSKTIKEVKA